MNSNVLILTNFKKSFSVFGVMVSLILVLISVSFSQAQVTPSVIISSNATNNSLCRGTAITFTATPTNGGATPTYQWKNNGVDAGTGATLTLNNNVNNDVITVVMTTSLSSGSVTSTTATSNAITLKVFNPTVVSTNPANISSCSGTSSATINATPSAGTVIDWYANTASTTTPFLSSSNSYTTPNISASTIYYAVARDTVKGCLSAKQSANNIALAFDGTDDKVTSNISTFTSTSEVTYETWVYANNFGSFNSFRALANHVGFTSGMVHFQFNGNKLRFDVNGFNNTGCTYTFSPNTWYHVAAVYSQKTLKYYVNGILETTFPNNSSVRIVGNSPFTVGSWDNSRYLNGRLDEFRIWNVARTQSEIQANMCEEIDQQAGLVLSYHFNDGVAGGNNNSVTTAIDASGNSNNGTLVNFTKTGTTSNYATGNGSVNRTPIAVTLVPTPTVTSSTSGATVCVGGSTTVSATASDGAKIDWYADASGGTALATGIDTYTTPTLSATTTYYAEARDTLAGCVSSSRTAVTATVNGTAPTAGITNNTGSTQLTCTTTSISVTATGGTSYSWSNSLGTSANASITAAGTYTVTVTGSNGCTATSSITVTRDAIAPTAGITNNTGSTVLTCATTAISVTATGGATYSWSNSLGSSANASITAAGTYTVTVTGLNGCTATSSITVTRDITTPTAGITNNTGSTILNCTTTAISVTATGGVSYSWNNSLGSSANASITAPGINTVTVTGTNGCTSISSITTTQDITAPTAGITNNTGSTILNCSRTSISVTATGGISYSWSNNLGSSTAISITAAGTYTVTVTGANGCTSTASIIITQDITAPTAGITNNTGSTILTCSTTAISVTATGGTSYSWSNSLGTSANANITAAGTYTVTVTGSNGCTATSSITTTQNITTPTASITNNIGSTVLTCATTAISVTATGGASYSWSNSLGTSANASITAAGTYPVTVTGANGCTSTASITVTQNITAPTTNLVNNSLTTELNCNTQSIFLTAGNTIFENFNNGLWNTSNFTLGAPSIGNGSVVNGAYLDPLNLRSPLRTFSQFHPDTNHVLTVSATIKFTPRDNGNGFMDDIAFIATRTSGTISNAGSEPVGAKIRIHNFSDGYTVLPDNYQGRFTDSFYRNPVRVTMTDNGTSVICRLVNLVTLVEYTHTSNTNSSQGDYVMFSGGSTTYWDDIQISYGNPNISYNWVNGNGVSISNSASTSITSPGTYNVTSTASNGCSTIANISITQNNATSTGDTTAFACNSFTWYSTTYNSSATPTHTFANVNGCDSVVTLHLTVGYSNTGDTTVNACNSFTWYGNTYINSANPTHIFTNASGCDSVVTAHIVINNSTTSQYNDTACNRLTLPWSQVVTTSGNYNHTYQTVNGCDSVVTAHIVINYSTTSSFNDTACNSLTLPWSQVVTTSGNYNHTYQTVNGCDSVVTANIVINYSTTSQFNDTACNTLTLPWSQVVTTSGNYNHTYQTVNGCDSVVTAHIVINYSTTSQYNDTACNRLTLPWSQVVTTSGNYNHTYQTVNGCDSVVTARIVINYSTSSSFNDTACNTMTLPWSQVVTTSGSYNHTYQTVNGCDSVVTANIVINYGRHNTTTQSACATYTWNGTAYTQSGTYTYAYTNASGCASVDTLRLTINALPTSAVAVNGTRCGTGTVSLSATVSSGNTVDWYAAASGGTALSIGSTSFTTPSISSTTSYYAEARNTITGCVSLTRTAVSATINSNLLVSVSITSNASNNIICSGTSVTFTATPTNGGTTPVYQWKLNGNNVGTNSNIYTTKTLANNDVVTVVITSNATCAINSPATSNSIANTVNSLPAAPVVTNGSRCSTGTVNLSATSATGTVVDWYESSSATTPFLSASTNYTTPSISASANYFVVSRDTVTGCLSSQPSQVNNALRFDGTNDFISVFTNTGIPIGNSNYTIEAWIKPYVFTSSTNTNGIIGWGEWSRNYQVNAFRLESAGLDNYWMGCDLVTTSRSIFAAQEWRHVACSYDGATRKIYVDGVVVASDIPPCGHTIPFSSNLKIGTTCNVEYFNGALDEIRVWNLGRTQSEIQANMNSTLTGNEPGLVSYYNFDQGVSGGNNTGISTLLDLTSNHNNGTLNNFSLTGNTSNFINGPSSVVYGSRTIVTATVNPLPTVASSSNGSTICTSGTTNLTATASAGAKIDWYAASTGGTALATGTGSFTTPTLTATTTYYAESRDTITGCISAVRTAVTATVGAVPTAVITNNTGSTILTCSRNAISLTATGGTSYSWSNSLGSSANASITSSGTYTVTVTGVNGCSATSSISITRNIATSTGDTTVFACNSFTWYGTTYTNSANPTHRFTNAIGCDSMVTANIVINYSTTSSFNDTACNTLTLPWGNVVTTSGSYNHTYQTVNGCDSVVTANIVINYGTHNTTTQSACATYTWNGTAYTQSGTYTYAYANASGCASVDTLRLTVNTLPASAVAVNGTRCGTGTVSLSATVTSGITVDWFADASGNTALSVGSTPFTTPSISTSTNFYAVARNTTTGCLSASRTLVNAVVNVLPASAVGVDSSRYGTGTISLSASVSTGIAVDWYAAESGGAALSTGSTSFTTPSISSTTIYYAQARNTTTGCLSATRTAVSATVNAILVVGVSISSNATNNKICRGTAVTFTATPTNGGNTPTYQWKMNGTNIFTGSQITLNNIQNNDQISVIMTTSLSASSVTSTSATSNAITLTVNNLPSVVSTTPAFITSCATAGSATINAVPTTGSVIDWYASTSSTTPLLTSSNSYTTPSISSTTTYYPVARDTVTGCQSNGLIAENMAINMGPNIAYIETPKTVTGSFTIEFWFKPAGSSSAGCGSWRCGEGLVDANTGDPNDRDFGITIFNDYVAFGMGNGSGNSDVSILSTTNVSARSWKHIAASWDSTTGAMKLYVNGNLEASAIGGTASRNGQRLMRLGSLLQAPGNGFYGYFSGSLDEVRIWKKVRTQADIRANYTSNINGREDGLAQYYNFNQGIPGNVYNANPTQLTLLDITPNGNNGSLNQFRGLGSTGIQGNWWGTFDLGFNPAKYPVVVTKITTPTVSNSSTGATICVSGTTTLTATASAGAKIDWYADATGGTALAIGSNNFTTPTLSATTTYYAEARDTIAACVSTTRTAVTATVGAFPTAGITNNTGTTVLTCATTAISVTATGGTSYSWSNNLGSSANASITAAGTYTVTVTGANGCTATSSIMVTRDTIVPTTDITNNTGSTVLTCATTAISVTATGGSTYSWNNSLGSSANASITAAGTYTVTVTGANGCTATSSITTTQNNTAPSAGITNNTGATVLTCSRTAISLTATGGTSFSWSNSLGSSANASINAPGIYTVTVTGSNGCKSTASIIVTQDNTATTTSIINNSVTTQLNCNTQSISLNASPAIFENFNNGQWDTSNFTLGAPTIGSGSVVNGAYMDLSGSRSPLRTVNQFHPDANHVLTVSATIKYDYGQSIGYIATRSSGTILNAGDEPYGVRMRLHNFNDGQTTLPDGIHVQLTNSFYNNPVRVTMIDNGTSISCKLINLVTLVEHNYTVNNTGSNGDYIMFSGDSKVSWDDIQISYGNPNISYNWVNGNGVTISNSASTNITSPGTYTVTSTASNSCSSTSNISITQNIATSAIDSSAFACNSFTWYGTTYTSSANPIRTFTKANGCDSVITLHLIVGHSNTRDTTVVACNSFTWYGTTYTSSTNSTRTYTNASGCDSVINLRLTINTPTSSIQTIAACLNYTWNGTTYSTSGTKTWIGTNAEGCDSIATLILTISTSGTYPPFGVVQNVVSTVCSAKVYRYTASVNVTGTTYNWLLPTSIGGVSGVTVDSGDVNSSRTLLIRYTSNEAAFTTDSIRVRTFNGCASKYTAVKLSINKLSVPIPASITVVAIDANNCSNRKYRFIAPDLPSGTNNGNPTYLPATGYLWLLVGNLSEYASIDSGDENSQKIVVSFSTNLESVSGDSIKLQYLSSCGNSIPRALKLTNTKLNAPVPSIITITALQSNVCGARKYRYTAPNLPAATKNYGAATGYAWSLVGSLSGSATIDSGEINSQKIVVTFTSNAAAATGDSIRLYYTSDCGNGARKASKLTNTLLSAPSAPASISMQTKSDVCNARTYRYIAPAVLPIATTTAGAANGYLWSTPTGTVGSTGTIDSGEVTSRIITVTYSSNAAAGVGDSIRLLYTSLCGDGKTKAQKLSNLVKNGCTPIAKNISTSRVPNTLPTSMEVNVYPNPTTSLFNVQVKSASTEEVVVRVMDLTGRFIKSVKVSSNSSLSVGSDLKAGAYILELKQGKEVKIVRVVKFK